MSEEWATLESVQPPLSLAETIRLQALAVIYLRRDVAANAELVATRRREWEEENAAEIADVKFSARILSESETHLRALALQAWEESDKSTKAVAPGCKVAEETVLHYDGAEAFAWAKKHGLCLTLDTKAFEAAVKAGLIPATVAEVEKRPVIKLASDLAAALGIET